MRRGRRPPVDKDSYVQPSPPLVDDMYGEQIPQVVAALFAHLELAGFSTPNLFLGDPSIRQLNELIDALHAHADAPVAAITRDDPRVAAAALAAYIRQLPDALVPSPFYEQLTAAVETDDYAARVAAVRDIIAELPEANGAVLHRLFDFLIKLGARGLEGNSLAQLAAFWTSILFPSGSVHRGRGQRVKDFRLVGLMLQQCACIFQGALDTRVLEELPLPHHLLSEVSAANERAKKWVKIKASLLRDSMGHFKIIVKEDQGGFYLDSIFETDVCDDRERLQQHDYVVSLGRKPVDDLSLSAVRELIKSAGSMLEVEVRRYAPSEADDARRKQQEESRQREEAQLRRYREQMADFVGQKSAPQRSAPPPQPPKPSQAAISDLLGLDLLGDAAPPAPSAAALEATLASVPSSEAYTKRADPFGGATSLGSSSDFFPSSPSDPFASGAPTGMADFLPPPSPRRDAPLAAKPPAAETNGRPSGRTLQLLMTADVTGLKRSSALVAFTQRFAKELAAALAIPQARIEVIDTELRHETGQVAVDFEFLPPGLHAGGGGPSVDALHTSFRQQLANQQSPLRRNALFGGVDPRVAAPPQPPLAPPPHTAHVPLSATQLPSSSRVSASSRMSSSSHGGGSVAGSAASLGADAFKTGESLLYLSADGSKKPATVVRVHTDDIEPYYTVKVEGQERGTVRSRLSRPERAAPPLAAFPPPADGAGWVDFGSAPFEPLAATPPPPPPPPSFGVSPSAPLEGFGAALPSAGFGADFGGGAANGAAAAAPAAAPAAPALSKEEEMKKRVEKYRGLSIEEKRAKIREELAAEQKAKREAAEAARKEAAEKAKAEREAKAKAEAEEKARKEAEKKAREEEYRKQVRAKIALEKKMKAEAEARAREEKARAEAEAAAAAEREEMERLEAEERARLEAEVQAAFDAAEARDGDEAIDALEAAVRLAEASGVRLGAEEGARARLRALHGEKLRREGERSRARAAVEAAMGMEDAALLQGAIAQARAAGVEEGVVEAAADRLVELEEAARLREEEEAKAREEEEAKARRAREAEAALRRATDEGEDEAALRAAIGEAEAAGVGAHVVWMSRQCLEKLEGARLAREEGRRQAAIAVEVALEAEEAEAAEAAIEAAVAAGVDEATVGEARAALEALRLRLRAEAVDSARLQLEVAVEAEDVESIREALELCVEVGLPEGEVEEARKELARVEAKREAEEAERREAAGEVEGLAASKLVELGALREAVRRAEAAGVEEEVMEGARRKLMQMEAEEAERLEAEEMARVEEEEARRLEEEAKLEEERAAREAAEAEERAAREAEERARLDAEEAAERARMELEERILMEEEEKEAEERAAREAAERARVEAEEAAEEARIEAEERLRVEAEEKEAEEREAREAEAAARAEAEAAAEEARIEAEERLRVEAEAEEAEEREARHAARREAGEESESEAAEEEREEASGEEGGSCAGEESSDEEVPPPSDEEPPSDETDDDLAATTMGDAAEMQTIGEGNEPGVPQGASSDDDAREREGGGEGEESEEEEYAEEPEESGEEPEVDLDVVQYEAQDDEAGDSADDEAEEEEQGGQLEDEKAEEEEQGAQLEDEKAEEEEQGAQLADDEVEAVLRRDSQNRFGMIIRGGGDEPIWLSRLGAVDVEDERARLREGDALVQIDGVAVDGMSLAQAREAIKAAGSELRLRARRRAERVEARRGEAEGGAAKEGGAEGFESFDADFEAEFSAAEASALLEAPAPLVEIVEDTAQAEAALDELRRVCDESQAAQQQLLICCAAYQAELALLEAEARAASADSADRSPPSAKGRGSAEGALLQAQTRKIQKLQADAKEQLAAIAALEAELKKQDGAPPPAVANGTAQADPPAALQARHAELEAENAQLQADLAEARQSLAAAQSENKLLAEHLAAALASAAKLR